MNITLYIQHNKKFAGNKGNHQNWVPFISFYKFWLIIMGMKQKKKSKMTDPKSRQFSIFSDKISGIGLWVNRINWCEEHWCGSTNMVVRLSDIRSKTGKNTKMHLGFFLLFPHEIQSKFIGKNGWDFLRFSQILALKVCPIFVTHGIQK